ncbi:helix-turn-helix domain-containing protein [Aeromonas media]
MFPYRNTDFRLIPNTSQINQLAQPISCKRFC